MKTSDHLNSKIIKAVKTSMQIEGCKPVQSARLKVQAKTLMEQQRVQVSVRGK